MHDFQNRHLTIGVQHEIPFETQMYLWALIDELKANDEIDLDYLQVFDLQPDGGNQKIIHSQEKPTYEKAHFIKPTQLVKEKIFVIDSEEYTTMLLASEY